MIELATAELGGVAVIEAVGRLDALASSQLDDTLKRITDAGRSEVLVDLAGVAYISSSCLRVLLLGARRTRQAGGDLKLCCLSERVRQVFELAGFDLVFELWGSQAEAVAAFASPSTGGPTAECA